MWSIIMSMLNIQNHHLGGTAPPTPKLACFVLYLIIINTCLKNEIYISE